MIRVLEHFHIKEYFDYIVGSELNGRRGKKEEVVEEALRLMAPKSRSKKLTPAKLAAALTTALSIRESCFAGFCLTA